MHTLKSYINDQQQSEASSPNINGSKMWAISLPGGKKASITIQHISRHNFLLGSIEGTLELELFRQAIDTITPQRGINTLWDMRQMNFNYSKIDFDIQEIFLTCREFSRERKNARIACVVDSDLAYGLLRVNITLHKKTFQNIQVFRSIDKAKQWLI